MRYPHIHILFLMLICQTSCGQKQTESHKDNINYDIKDTVTSHGPNTMVRHLTKGRNGTILFAASWGGIFRYDGKSFRNLTSKIGSRRYWNVLEDRRENLWFATTDSGVYRYNTKSFQHYTTREGLASNGVFSIYEDRAGIIWFGTGGGISRYDGKSFQNFTTKERLSDNGIHTILEDKTGKLWFGTSGGVCYYDGKKFTVFQNNDGKAINNVWSIIEDKKGNIWFGGNGLWRYNGSTVTSITRQFIGNVYEDSKGNIWTTGEVKPNGSWTLSRLDQKSLYNKNPTVTEIMSQPLMLCGILEANDGSIWVGSMHGVYRYDGKTTMEFKSKKTQK